MNKPRKQIRLKGYDYSQSGWYFVTICTKNRECIFGDIVNEHMILNKMGNIIDSVWQSLPNHHNVNLDTFQIMPNHVHFILRIPSGRGIARNAPTFRNVTAGSLPCIIRSFKSEITKQIHRLTGNINQIIFQRNYYEHIIRAEIKLYRIRKYIIDNPKNWESDRNNPNNLK